MSNAANNSSKKDWLLPEFGLNNNASHSTQKRLKTNIPDLIVNEQAQKLQYENELKKGYQKGYEDAINKATPEINAKLVQLSSLITELNSYKSIIDDKLKENIYQFVLLICEKILMEKLQSSSEVIASIIQKALGMIETNTLGLKLHCNEALCNQLTHAQIMDKIANLTIEKDNSLKDFNFRIESDKQFLAFNLQESLKEIIDNTKDAFIGTSQNS